MFTNLEMACLGVDMLFSWDGTPSNQKRQMTREHQDDDEHKGKCQQLMRASFDASLGTSVLLQDYIDVYGKCVFFIAPVLLQALDTSFTRELVNLDDIYHSKSDDDIILFNFYVAVAFGAKQR